MAIPLRAFCLAIWLSLSLSLGAGDDLKATEMTFNSLDADKNEYLDHTEVIQWMKSEDSQLTDEDAREEVEAAFEVFDHNRDNVLNQAEFAEAMRQIPDGEEEGDEGEEDDREEDVEEDVES